MSETSVKKVRKPRKQKVKQGHKLVWLTLIIILIPVCLVGYVILDSMEGSGKPVEGTRFSSTDLNPSISESAINHIQTEVMSLEGVESTTVNLKSATLRININMQDGMSEDQLVSMVDTVYNIVNNYLPIDMYFTNTSDSKNYDLEITAYNYLVDDSHPASGQIQVQLTKTGAGTKVVDILTTPRNSQLAQDVQYMSGSTSSSSQEESSEEVSEEEYTDGYWDEYGNFIPYDE